jgi:glycosyltransferase involved in cell wall biosynthesis
MPGPEGTIDSIQKSDEMSATEWSQVELSQVELSIVMPCLNEADTVKVCVEKAISSIRELGLRAEVIVADNGSTDGSQSLAESAGARVVNVKDKGYGAALMGGIEAARGKFILMGDADDSYDFSKIEGFVVKLREGADLVQGCRLPGGGGTVMPGAMPWSHRWIGNPMFSRMSRLWFGAPIHDIYCGMRGFTKTHCQSLKLQCTGMEFATEMIIKSSLFGARISQTPITLWPDGRKAHGPHLRTVRDGWRTLRFFLMFSPRWLYLLPGAALMLMGFVGYLIAMPGLRLGGIRFDVHTLMVASGMLLMGYQLIIFAILAKTFAIGQGLLPMRPAMARFYEVVNLERGILVGLLLSFSGIVMIAAALLVWSQVDFGDLSYSSTMRLVVPGVTAMFAGVMTIFSSFLASMLGLQRR